MKVVFLESVEGTALVGDVKEVKNGFARNYLLPRGIAAPAKEPYLHRAGVRAAIEAKKQEELDRDAQTIADKLDGAKIEIIARVGEQGKLYGSVTTVHVAAELAKLIGDDDFDHRKILLPEAVKEVGTQTVRVRLTRNVEAAVELEVIAEGIDEDDMPVVEESEDAAAEDAPADDAGEATADDSDDADSEPEAVEEQPEAVEEQPEASGEESEDKPEAVEEQSEAVAEEEASDKEE